MTTLSNVIALLMPLAAAAVVDKLILYRHKYLLHDYAVKYWCRLEDTPVPDILKATATRLVSLGNRVASNRKKSIFLYLMASFSFLCIAYAFNTYLSGGNWKMGPNGDIFDVLPFPHVLVLSTVVTFDIITLILTRRFLTHLQTSAPLVTAVGIVSHIIVLIFLLILCLASSRHVESWLININAIGERGNQRQMAETDLGVLISMSKSDKRLSGVISSNYLLQAQKLLARDPKLLMVRNPKTFIRAIESSISATVYSHIDNSYLLDVYQSVNAFCLLVEGYPGYWTYRKTTYVFGNGRAEFIWRHDDEGKVHAADYLLAATLIVPALILTALLLFIYISKFVLFFARFSTMYFLELLTDRGPKELMPFTLFGATFSLIAVLLKTVSLVYCCL